MQQNRTALALALLLLPSLAACRTVYEPQVRHGPAASSATPTAVLFPVACHSSEDKCRDEYADALTGKLRSELEFAGFNIVDAEKLVREARTRKETSNSLSLFRTKLISTQGRQQIGAIFEDLPPQARRQLLREARADGVVTGAIVMHSRGNNSNWIAEVQIRYALADDGQSVWVARCKHESFWNEKNSWSIEQAAACALRAALSPARRKGS